ncbi:class I SAM-dependent methyltransferase, partial [bacterium]|nr:class I SAM-dependent methyltransferase [bacterium]
MKSAALGKSNPKDRPFNRCYSDEYDLLYQEKNYEAECDMIEEAFRRFSKRRVRSILDLGCGTGNHAIPLSNRGYRVTGVDRSQDMLRHARSKAARMTPRIPHPPSFVAGDLRSLKLHRQFDAALMMFAVLGYQVTNQDALDALENVRRHLRPGGIFIFDYWHGPAVLALRPGDRVKMVPTPEGKVIRITQPAMDVNRHTVTVNFTLIRQHRSRIAHEASESHCMRFFFPLEIDLLLKAAGLSLLALRSFGDLDREPDLT